MPDPDIRKGYLPGAIGRITALHGAYYGTRWGFGPFFEAKVARELADFIDRYEPGRDGIWTAWCGNRIHGAIAIDGLHAADRGAHLRWFIVSDRFRGKGFGNRLIRTAVAFCRSRRYERIYLWTFEGLDVAGHLYEKVGFRCTESCPGDQWGTPVIERCFTLCLAD